MDKLRIGSFFSGIGAFEKALERLEIPHRTVFYCEIDRYAAKSYSLIHGVSESLNLWDITKVDEKELPDFDLMTWGFPCQSISVAGKQDGVQVKCESCGEVFPISDLENDSCPFCGGKEIKSYTRSGLYYDGLRILKHKMPKYSIIENVKNLVGKKFQAEFNQILCDLDDAGYNNYWQVLNAKDYGVPQNRERVFIISIRKDIDNGNFKFPKGFDNGVRLKDLLQDKVDKKYYISQEKTESPAPELVGGIGEINFGKQYRQGNRVYSSEKTAMSLMSQPVGNTGGNSYLYLVENDKEAIENISNEYQFAKDKCMEFYNKNGYLPEMFNPYNQAEVKDIAPTQTTSCNRSCSSATVLIKDVYYKIRKLTPLECFRLMGFYDQDYYILKENGISDSQIYKMAGNSIVVQVLEGILNNLLKSGANVPDYFYTEQLALFG